MIYNKEKCRKSTENLNNGSLANLFAAVKNTQNKAIKPRFDRALSDSAKSFSLVGHLYHTNSSEYLLFWLFTIGLLQYDFSLASDIHSVESGQVKAPKNFDLSKAKQVLANTCKIRDIRSIVQLMLNLRSTVCYSLDFSKLMDKNRYGGTYHQIDGMNSMVHADYTKAWSKPKYMDGLTLFFNSYDHIVVPDVLTDIYRALFSELVAITGSQNNVYTLYTGFFGDALDYINFVPTTATKNVNKKTFLMKLENDAEFVLENAKLAHNIYVHSKILSDADKKEYHHYNGERIRIDSDILLSKKDVNKLIKQVN